MEKAAEAEPSWAPLTPVKTILSKPTPICGDMQETEAISGLEKFPPGRGGIETGQEPHGHRIFSSAASDVVWATPAISDTPGAVQGSFTSLLALADAAMVPNGSFLCFSDSYFWRAPISDGPWTGGNCTAPNTHELADLPTHMYDLNLPPEIMEDAVSETSIPQFAPITPNKSLAMDYQPTTQDQLRVMLEEVRQGKEIVVDPSATDLPSAASKNMENLNIQKVDEENGSIDAIKTPQQKPRRKKHRPKVVREGKPKQTPKPKTPKSVVAEGEKQVKRKCIRQKGTQISAEGSPEEVIGDSISSKLENPPKKSCKRALNFDSEEQPTNKAAGPDAQTEQSVEMNSTHHFSQEFEEFLKQTQIARLKEKTNFSLSVMIGGGQPTEQNNHYGSGGQIQNQTTNMSGIGYNSLQAYESLPWIQNVHKRKRSDKVQSISSSILTSSTSAETSTQSRSDPRLNFLFASTDSLSSVPEVQDKRQNMGCMFAFSQNERSTKKRSRAHTRVTDLTKFAQYRMMPNYKPPEQGVNSMKPHTCIETLLAEMQTPSRKKRTKRPKEILLMHQKQQQALLKSGGGKPKRSQRKMLPVEIIIEQLKNLDINRESSRNENHEMNAIVPYRYSSPGDKAGNKMMVLFQRDGTIVPFDPVKKRKPRPKVDLDDETTRVWKLLLEDINSQGIDGTDEEKAKWWEEERRVFRGRADSFIARMHLVQGDRRFSPWKGSVVDSVVGVFLTQNVSDHLSSSAFMSLVARYPPKSKQKQCSDEGTSSLINDPDVSILDLEYTSKWREKMPSPAGSISVNEIENNEEVEMITIEEFSRSTTKRVSSTSAVVESEIDAMSVQDSVISSQNSSGSMKAPTAERRGSSSENSEIEDPTERGDFSKTIPFTSSTSFMQLLHMAGSSIASEFHIQENGDVSSNENSKTDPESSKHCKERQDTIPSTENSMLEDECSQQSRGDPKYSDSSKIECGNISCSREDGSMQQQKMDHVVLDGNNQEGERILKQHPLAREADIAKSGNSRPKTKSTGKEKVKFDWDSLRKEAECRCGKKGRTSNTTDSVDWERIRSAEVEEIADAIRDRGMNNVLAGRIQDFLNRLIKEHETIDLEWLRDVPPDKAKEFLLSIRGLGLKSVECVRLLTLHHLAFPVDTNVGRIAVRLGWVPLQPLPESLQLHLLELYPVLESIQKFLWPRLCKLDQRTLYELHYQMITFGKVFCTKSKPNCNACPMRGECRHFASAFASARLALPEPEVRSIVGTSTGSTMPSQNNPKQSPPLALPEGTTTHNLINPEIVQLSLPPTEQNGISSQNDTAFLCLQQRLEEERPGPSNCHPIIEEPASPQHECTQIAENDETDIEDFGEIPTIRLNMEEFTLNLQNYMQKNMELQEGDMSKALVALTPEAASLPVPRLKNVSRLRTEHLVYDLPDEHPLLDGLDKREPDDPGRYLLAIWTPGETATSTQPPEKKCNSQELGALCDDSACFSCHSIREANSQTVRGTILIPCRTAMRGSFPLNGTYFQVNEVFADHESSLHPIDVPRDWLWKLQRRTVYFGTSIPSIFKGLTTEGIQHCFWRGYVCVRGFDRKSRAPRPLMARLHFPASKLSKGRGRMDEG